MNLRKVLAAIILTLGCHLIKAEPERLSTTDESYLHGIQGFGTEIRCELNTCLNDATRVKWTKDGKILFSGTLLADDVPRNKMALQHYIVYAADKENLDCDDESGCNDDKPCPDGKRCLQNNCCPCENEEFTLIIRNMTLDDAGIYKCEFEGKNGDTQSSLEFELEVLESGLSPDFTKNITFNHLECCNEQKISQKCQDICRPGQLETHTFDPIDCVNSDLNKFLHCVTEGGNISHVHCCKMQLVPPFCWEFCSGNLPKLRDSHRLCLYWLPEILECYERAYLPFPGPPDHVRVNTMDSSRLRVCWDPPHYRHGGETDIDYYTVHYKEVPRFPFMGPNQGVPFLPPPNNDGDDQEEGSGGFPNLSNIANFHSGGRHKRELEFDADDTSVELSSEVTGTLKFRKKRQTWIFVTHHAGTNKTEIREFKFQRVNTTGGCLTIEDLRASTQYFVYVTANNHFGASLPSVRAVAATESISYSNASLPDIEQCCRTSGVAEHCIPSLCQLEKPPSHFGALGIVLKCRTEFSGVAPCLADGRDHTPCCKTKGVTGECLNLCNGTAKYMGLSAVLCLSLDMYTIYNCLREGYLTHPTPPQNVTVYDVTSFSAMISWDQPASNADKVVSYSAFVRKDDELRQGFVESENVSSPHLISNLEPNRPYMAFIIAHTKDGSSLRSTTDEFYTIPTDASSCSVGHPLLDSEGLLYQCGFNDQCPITYKCVPSLSNDDKFCCPAEGYGTTTESPAVKLPNISKCCEEKGITNKCKRLCSYNTTVEDILRYGPECVRHLNSWVECGADGRDHRPCCAKSGIPKICQDFCSPPLPPLTKGHLRCIQYVNPIVKCGIEGVLKLPGQPRNFEVVTLTGEKVTLSWEAPTQKTDVDKYEVKLYENDILVQSENVTGVTHAFDGLTADREYVAQTVSLNEHGSSIPSNNVTFTPRVDSSSSEEPSPPHQVHEDWNKGSVVNVSWEWTGKMLDGKTDVPEFEFFVYYREEKMDKAEQYKMESAGKNRSLVLRKLTLSTNYQVYVTVKNTKNNKESKSSEIISITTVADKSEAKPGIQLDPDRSSYVEGSKLNISCSIVSKSILKIHLTFGDFKAEGNGHANLVIDKLERKHDDFPIQCTASDGQRGLRTQKRIQVNFGASANALKSTVHATKGMEVHLKCEVSGSPKPEVTWSYSQTDGSKSKDSLISTDNRLIDGTNKIGETDKYDSTLKLLKSVKSNTGFYYCQACNEVGAKKMCSTAKFNLTVSKVWIPPPDYIHTCCVKKGVKQECMTVCKFNIDITMFDNANKTCLGEFSKYIGCIKDGIDHSECCIGFGMPKKCLGLCDLSFESKSPDVDLATCSQYQKFALTCAVTGRVEVPGSPTGLKVVPMKKKNSIRVEWKKPQENGDNVEIYGVFYRPMERTDESYREESATEQFIVLSDLEPGVKYELHVTAANYIGFSSRYAELKDGFSLTPDGSYKPPEAATSSGRGIARTFLLIALALLLAAIIILAVIMLTRRQSRLPAFIQKFTQNGRSPISQDSSIAFENPGYDREGQIRGLPGDPSASESLNGDGPVSADWHRAELETPQPPESPKVQQKGMKYSKLT